MTQPHDDEYADILRRVLRTEAEEITPSAEGLERIRARIDERSARRLWWQMPWVRPAMAVGGAMVLAAVVMVGTPGIRATVISAFKPTAPQGTSTPIVPPGNNHGYPTNGTPTPAASPSDSGESQGPGGGGCDQGGGRVTASQTPSASPSQCPSTSPSDGHSTEPTSPSRPSTPIPTQPTQPTRSTVPPVPSNTPTTTVPKPSDSNAGPVATP